MIQIVERISHNDFITPTQCARRCAPAECPWSPQGSRSPHAAKLVPVPLKWLRALCILVVLLCRVLIAQALEFIRQLLRLPVRQEWVFSPFLVNWKQIPGVPLQSHIESTKRRTTVRRWCCTTLGCLCASRPGARRPQPPAVDLLLLYRIFFLLNKQDLFVKVYDVRPVTLPMLL